MRLLHTPDAGSRLLRRVHSDQWRRSRLHWHGSVSSFVEAAAEACFIAVVGGLRRREEKIAGDAHGTCSGNNCQTESVFQVT